ncbi:hypothetical protein [Aquiflexum sp.]|uniref:hypothetical protein n=1 Tax=Aquiflexum sp. TaxID=1872584 RepID=UPI00359389F1
MKNVSLILLLFLSFSLTSCDGEKVMKAMLWGFNRMVGEGYFPSDEILALGEFEGAEVLVSKTVENGENKSTLELRLHNGKNPALRFSEENTARKCAELYAVGYSKINDYKTIKISFIQTDPFNAENFAVSEYSFEVKDLLNIPTPENHGIQ